MKIYIAARYPRYREMAAVARRLRASKRFTVVSSWVKGNHRGLPAIGSTGRHSRLNSVAKQDLLDLERAEAIVLFDEWTGTCWPGGGRNFEMGYAFAKGKRVFVIGANPPDNREHIFHFLEDVTHFKTLDEFLSQVPGSPAGKGTNGKRTVRRQGQRSAATV